VTGVPLVNGDSREALHHTSTLVSVEGLNAIVDHLES
jgi:hypothetical protein